MPTVSEYFGVDRVVGALVGLELEVEGSNLPHAVEGTAWRRVEDGSLRGGAEFIFREPLGVIATKAALLDMNRLYKENGTKIQHSFRTSTHVHINVSNLDLNVVKSMLAAYYLVEPLLINYCAERRRGNRFCLSTRDSHDVISHALRFFEGNRVPNQNEGKYSALNLCTLAKYGTLEVRCLEGTDDYGKIHLWVRALLSIRKAAKALGTARDVVNMDDELLATTLFPSKKLQSTFLVGDWKHEMKMQRSYLIDLFGRL